MIITVRGYKFNTEVSVNSVRNQLKQDHGLPVSEDSVTTEYVDYYESFDDQGEIDFYYIHWPEGLPDLTGKPTEFEVNTGDDEL